MTILPLGVDGLKEWREGHFGNLPPKCPKIECDRLIQRSLRLFVFSLSPSRNPIVGAFSTHAAVGERRRQHRSCEKVGAEADASFEPTHRPSNRRFSPAR